MTDDITNDLALLDDWLAGKGYGEEAGLVMRAMDLIRKQADEIEKLRAAIYEKETVAEIRAAASRKNYVTVK